MSVVIHTQNLTKRFRDLVAVDSVDLEVNAGECFGLLGPNGAGKTTLIRMLIDFSPPSGGEVIVFGDDLRTHARRIKAQIGVIPQLDNLDPDLSVRENLVTFARYFEIPRVEALKRSEEVLALFELTEKGSGRIVELSGGMKRRLMIARGLLNRPRLLVLDEPTVGLDPQAKYLVWRKLFELKGQEVTQLLSTQNMEEATVLCDRVAIMNQGKILSLDTPARLIAQHVGDTVWEVHTDFWDKDNVRRQLLQGGFEFDDAGDRFQLFHVPTETALESIDSLKSHLSHRPATLEDVFFNLTGRMLQE